MTVVTSNVTAKVVLQGESVDPEPGVTDVVAPTMLRAECYRVAIGRIDRLPAVRFWVTPMLDPKMTMGDAERDAFVLGWFAYAFLAGAHPYGRQPQPDAPVKRVPC